MRTTMTTTTHTQFESFATNVSPRSVGEETVIDFDVAANEGYEIQSCAMVNDDGEVVEAAIRFGRIEERPEIGVNTSILENAWTNMVSAATGFDRLEPTALEADMSDFDHVVPHLRVERENVETYDCETLTVETFADAVEQLADLVSDVLRADAETMDAEIDGWL